MPNTKGGKSYKRSKHVVETAVDHKKIPRASEKDDKKTPSQVKPNHDINVYPNTKYATLVKFRGGNMTEVHDVDGNSYIAVIPGSMRKRVFVNPGDILLIQCRTQMTMTDKYDIIYKYSPQEIKYLQSIHVLKFTTDNEETDNICFTNETVVKDNDTVKDSDSDSDSDSGEKAPPPAALLPAGNKKLDRDKRHIVTLDDL